LAINTFLRSADPDVKRYDGVYSRYLTDFSLGEGRYDVEIVVDDNENNAFSYQTVKGDGSCCQALAAAASSSNVSPSSPTVSNEMTGTFTRIVRGDSFRVEAAKEGLPTSATLPPARIMDLRVDVLTDKQSLEFSWTAPGEDLDSGEFNAISRHS